MSYSNELWSCVMTNVIERNPNSKHKWRELTSRDADCSQCSDAGGGALIQCSTLQCNHEYHLPCAWGTQGSFVLENDTGNLQYECEAHHIPVTFCTCKQEYDETLPMISCDDCNEWFHNHCVGLKGEPPEVYTCQSCKSLKASGKKVSEDKINKNREKENRSADVQAANKAMSYLMYLHESVVPIMKNMYVTNLVKHKDITETLKILTTQFVEDDKSILGTDAALNDDVDVERFGTSILIQEWIDQLQDCEAKVLSWIKGSNETIVIMLTTLEEPSLNVDHISVIENQINELDLWHKKIDGLPFIESSTGFVTILDCLKWLVTMLKLIHTDDDLSDQQFYNQLSNHIKLAPSKIRKLEHSNYEFCSGFADVFNRYTTKASEMISSMSFWSSAVEKKISGATSATLNDLEKMLEDATTNFPRMPLAVDDLKEVIDSSKAVDEEINDIVNNDEMRDLDTCLRIKDNANNVAVIIPSVKKLNLIISSLYFLHDYDTHVNSKERAEEENVTELLQRTDYNGDETNTSIFYQSLTKSMEENKKKLEQITSEVAGIKEDANNLLCNQSVVDIACENKINSLLNDLRNHKLLTIEENVLDYITKGKQITSEATSYMDAKEQHDLADVEVCYKALSDMAEDITVDAYSLAKSIKENIRTSKENLQSLLKSAQELWKNVKSLISNCENGQTTYQEDFDLCFNTAMSSGAIINKDIINCNNKFKEEVSRQIPVCNQKLNDIVDPINHLDDAKLLLNQIQHLPFPMTLSKSVLLRFNTCSLVNSCRTFIAAENIDDELKQCQELRQQLFALINSQITGVEKDMIETIREDFLFKLFKAEYSLSRHSKIAFDEVKIVLTNASLIGEKATKSSEFLQFSAEIDEFDKLHKNIIELLQVVTIDIDKGSEKSKLSSDKDYEEVFNYWHTNLLASQNKLRELSSVLVQKKFTDVILENQLASSMGLVDNILQAINIHKEVNRNDRDVSVNVLPPIQLVQLTSVTNKLKQQLESSTNLVLQQLLSLLSDYHCQAIKLNEHAVGLIPQRAKRKKQKTEQFSVSVIEDILNQPIAQVFHLPMRESLMATLDGYYDLRKQIQEFISGKNVQNNADLNLDENIKDNITRTNDLKQAIEFQPVDIDYAVVLSWVSDVLSWMQSISTSLGDDESPAPGSLTFKFAAAKIAAGNDLFVTIDKNVLEILHELKVVNNLNEISLDDMTFNGGLCIPSAVSLLYLLQIHMADTKAFEAEFDECQHKEIGKRMIKDLHTKMSNLVIVPKEEIVKTIEAYMQKFSRNTTSNGRVIDSDKMRTIYDEEDDDDYEDFDNDREDLKSPPKPDKEPSSKKAKTENDKKVTVVKKEKPKKIALKCCNSSCNSTSIQNSSYCSDTCAIAISESFVSALLSLRNILSDSNCIDANPELKSLKESFLSKNDNVDITIAISDINNGIMNFQKLLLNDKNKASPKNMGLSSILQCLPSAGSFLAKADHENNDDKDKFRLDVRYRLEDILITSLIRQGVFGAISIGAVLAVDFEEELHKKHSSKKDGQKDLKNHYLMLMRNLKQTHNDHLILRLVNSTLKFEDLLNMTDKQFAKEDVQIARAQQRIEAAQKSYVKESVVNTLEKMVGTTMAGNETWRSKEVDISTAPMKSIDDNSMDIDDNLASSSYDMNDDANVYNDELETSVDDEKSPEKQISVPKKVVKRPLDADAAARYASSAKMPRLDSDEASSESAAQNSESMKAKEPSKVLALLKQTSQSSTSPSKKKSPEQTLPTILKLLSSVGTDKFTVIKPNGFQFTCSGSVTNKKVQGLLEKTFTIDGKVKVDELNKFISNTIDKGKKIIDCTRMYALENDRGFDAFCSEFVAAERVGLCHISKTVDGKSDGKISFYVIPKAMKPHFPFLNKLETLEDDEINELLFYGIIISAEPGPDLYVNASPRLYDIFTSSNKETAVKISPTTTTKQQHIGQSIKVDTHNNDPNSKTILKKTNPIPSSDLLQKIRKVATFVADQPNGGSAMINKLKNDTRSKTETPFLFDSNEYYSVFVSELKDALLKKK